MAENSETNTEKKTDNNNERNEAKSEADDSRERLSQQTTDLARGNDAKQERKDIERSSEKFVNENKLPGLELTGFDDEKKGSKNNDSKTNAQNSAKDASSNNSKDGATTPIDASAGQSPTRAVTAGAAAPSTALADAVPTAIPKGPTLRIDTKLVGTNRKLNEGSGFLVAPDGKKAEPLDGKRLIATAAHVIGESHLDGTKEGYIYSTIGKNFQSADLDANKELGREEIEKQAKLPENPAATDSEKAEAKEKAFQFNHILQNFDKINGISKELEPGRDIKGITEAGLKEYYKRAADITVKTSEGEFKASIISADPTTDAALIEIKGLDKKTEKSLGDNIPITEKAPGDDEPVKTVGFRAIPGFKRSDGLHARFFTSEVGKFFAKGDDQTAKRDISFIRSSPGMSGGPTLNAKGEAIGVNSAIGVHEGKDFLLSTPSTEIMKMLRSRMKK